jgi:isopenicillin N synthase-like dioxygenase
MSGEASIEIPAIDLESMLAGDSVATARCADEVDTACADVGFMIVSGHGVPTPVIENLHDAAHGFFSLPLDEKRRVRSPVSNLYQGYAHPGPDKGDHTSERQSFNVQRFDTSDQARSAGYPDDLDDLFFDALWPAEPVGFGSAVRAYFAEMERLVDTVLGLLETALDVAAGSLTSLMNQHLSNQAINYYSDDIESGHEASPYRFKAHQDGSLITILHQDDGPGSLQLHRRGAGWLNVPPTPGTVIVNTGEILTRLSNGRYPATPHRVLHPPAGAASAPRISAPHFAKPGLDARIGPLPELVERTGESVGPTLTGREWYRRNQQQIDDGYDSTQQYEDLAARGEAPA